MKLTSHMKYSLKKPRFSQHRFHAQVAGPRKHPLNAKPILKFDFTNYLELISRSSSIKIYYQTFPTMWVVRNLNFPFHFGQ